MKNNQYKWMWVTIIVLAIFNIVPLTILWLNNHNEKERHGGGGRMHHFMEQELNLTDNQKIAFRDARSAHFMQTQKLSDSIRLEKQEINKLLFSANVDSALIKQHILRIAQIQTKLEWLTYQHFDRLRKMCTPEQSKKFEAALQEMFSHDYHKGGRGGKYRGGNNNCARTDSNRVKNN